MLEFFNFFHFKTVYCNSLHFVGYCAINCCVMHGINTINNSMYFSASLPR